VLKYLERYSEPEARAIRTPGSERLLEQRLAARPWEAAVVVPAYREDIAFVDHLREVAAVSERRVVVIVVANLPEEASAADVEAAESFEAQLRARCDGWVGFDESPTLVLASLDGADLLLVDRCRPGFRLPRKQAVGLARKLGNDVAVALWVDGWLQTPWIHQSDGDALPPQGHFDRKLPEGEGAVVFPFAHVAGASPQVFEATLKHEAWLRYHVLGLSWAGSRYAWHAIGSCIAVHANSYVSVRGFPKRDAAEDFHLLQKVCKVAVVRSIGGPRVRIISRRSDRAPVGTGAAVERLLVGPPPELEHPDCYAMLRGWLRELERFSHSRDATELSASVTRLDERGDTLAELRDLGCFERLEQLTREASNQTDLLRRSLDWFDGIKTLHLLHGLRSRGRRRLPAAEALARAPFTRGADRFELGDVRGWQQVCEHLEGLERRSVAVED
jgi:hypothetical protein